MSAGAPVQAAIACRDLRVRFGAVDALDGADLDAPAGSLTAVIGPSGCGKTTLLRSIAGFVRPDSGEISTGGRLVVGPRAWVPPQGRNIGMVFQDYALFPHLDVAGNVGYALGRRRDPARVEQMLDLVGLAGMGARRVSELSGGQQQRVALARALAGRPSVVLLDEPFSNLDAALRAQVRGEVKAILAASGVTALLVTHDQEEALSMADHVAVMRAGRVVQSGPPDAVYRDPRTAWVAGFLGAVDIFATRAADGVAGTPLGDVTVPPARSGEVHVLVRPEDVGMAAAGNGAPDGAVPGTVVAREFFGHDQLVSIDLEGGVRVRHRGDGGEDWALGAPVRVWLRGPATVVDR